MFNCKLSLFYTDFFYSLLIILHFVNKLNRIQTIAGLLVFLRNGFFVDQSSEVLLADQIHVEHEDEDKASRRYELCLVDEEVMLRQQAS
jgi:hypothetical protein